MGVWIETDLTTEQVNDLLVTPCMGVWIETTIDSGLSGAKKVTPCMGVWIETDKHNIQLEQNDKSHPVWVCGLKL